MRAVKVSFVMLMKCLEKPLCDSRVEAFAWETNHMIRVLELSVPSQDLKGGERGLESPATNGQ